MDWSYESNGCARNFYLGAIVQGVWRTESPSGVQGRSPDRDLGMKSPRNWSILQTLLTYFDSRNDQHFKILYNSRVCFTVGVERHFGGLAPSPWLASPLHESGTRINNERFMRTAEETESLDHIMSIFWNKTTVYDDSLYSSGCSVRVGYVRW